MCGSNRKGVRIFRTYPSLINSDQATHTTSEVLYEISKDLRSKIQRCLTYWPFVSHRPFLPDIVVDGDGVHVRFEISQPRLRQAMRIAAVNKVWRNYTGPALQGQAVIDPILVVGFLATRRQTGAVTVEEGKEEILMPVSMAFRLPVQVVRQPLAEAPTLRGTTDEVSGQTSHDHRADRQGAPMTLSDEMILGALHFDLYERTLRAEHLPSNDRDSGSPALHGVTTLRVRRRPAE